jgi:hypothetical protein
MQISHLTVRESQFYSHACPTQLFIPFIMHTSTVIYLLFSALLLALFMFYEDRQQPNIGKHIAISSLKLAAKLQVVHYICNIHRHVATSSYEHHHHRLCRRERRREKRLFKYGVLIIEEESKLWLSG